VSKRFSYSILTYKHSLFLGEVINVGVLFVFPDENLIEFHYPKKISRLKGLYQHFNESLIREYLKAFEKKSHALSGKLDKYIFGFNDILTENFIIQDASALQFSDFRNAIYYTSAEEISKKYYELLLGEYHSEAVKSRQNISDDDLIRKVKHKVFELNTTSKEYIKTDDKRILRNKHIQFKSDFYWKNGSLNYAKAVSFDLGTEEGIINKSLLLNGQLRHLEKSKYKDVHIDLIIHQPENRVFSDVIEEASAIIQENQIQKRVFTNWSEYSLEIAENIKPL
jgi:hypothetical protein